jgi:hypothetical protein
MARLSINEAWSETATFVKHEWQLIYPIGFLLIALPGALLRAAVPVVVPGQLPEPGLWLALLPVAIVLTLIGNIAISRLALRTGTSVAESLQHGARRFFTLFLAALLTGLALMAVALPVIILLAGIATASGNPAIAASGAILFLPIFAFVWTRLILMTPIAAAEEGGPVAVIRRSWSLTAGNFWPLLGFLALLVLVALIVSMAVGVVFGSIIVLAAGQPLPGTLSAWLILIVSALVQAMLSSVFAVVIARVYAQLAPPDRAGIFA